ncbi:hypothetical protein [Gluconobacter frateurii]|uniref:Transposase n=1 Tax=Gluconobacter frateurii NRIC 0228 TaxID=1307946 RepID=A0ABQ0QFH5_9PROT|nr:hypothetical protein [Gluconobacter frateurii]GBR17069.1 hypothetical protein AA0228_2940 [Gluconobacter frateurii NRIC 0228]GLP90739.1 hypothetical protein GCM10007868_18140 [Gluconobacter frateurii]
MKTPRTESYLGTGNRSQLNHLTLTALFGGSKARGSKMLPRKPAGAIVSPIHTGFAHRLQALRLN